MVMISTLFVAALAGIAAAVPTGYSSSYGSSSSSSSGCDSSSGCGSSSMESSKPSGCDSSSGCGNAAPPMMQESSSMMMMEATSTMAAEASSYTPPASSSYNYPQYGSGSSSYGSSSSSGYDSCVQQCVAQFGQPSSMGSMMGSSTESETPSVTMGSSGSGSTVTVIVAPSPGVLRYVPFAMNVSVGDTVMFKWMASPHTVTKSSALEICNKTSDHPFTSGVQNASFTFTQVINDTNPLFYYCGVPTHCQKGMFGMINPGNAAGQPSSVENMMPALAANNTALATAWAATKNYTGAAATWGGGMDLSGLSPEAQMGVAENVMYTRMMMNANPNAINESGELDLSKIDPAQLMVTPDVVAAAANSPAPAASAGSSGSPAAAPPTTPSAAPNNTPAGAATSGASALASPRVVVALAAVAAAIFAL